MMLFHLPFPLSHAAMLRTPISLQMRPVIIDILLLHRRHQLLKLLHILDPRQIPLLNPLDRQRRNQRRAHPAPVLRRTQHHRVPFALRPVQYLSQCLSSALLEVRVLVEHTPVGADVAGVDVFLAQDRRDAAGGDARGAGADEFREPAAEFEFGFGGVDRELGGEFVVGFLEVLEGVFFDEAEERGVEGVGLAELVDVLGLEEEVLVVVQVDEDQAEDLAEVEARDHFFEGLLAGPGGVFVDFDVVGGHGEDEVVVVEGAVLAVDGHGHVGGEVHVGEFGDGAAVFHVGGVAAGAEYAAYFHGLVGICGGD